MKRNLDLIRKILLDVEGRSEPFGSTDIEIDGFDSAEICYHVGLLAEVGFIHAVKSVRLGGETRYLISSMTFDGHDYLDVVRSPKVWQCVKDTATKAGVTLTIMLAKETATRLVSQALARI